MPKKLSVKRVLELSSKGISQRQIAITLNYSRNSIAKILEKASSLNVTWDIIKEKEENEAYCLLFPENKVVSLEYAPIDFEYVHKELKRVGVTLKLLWEEYVYQCKTDGTFPYSYNAYREKYHEYIEINKYTSHIEHKPAQIIEVDWSGSRMCIVDEFSGEIHDVYLFVGCLPYSRYSYVEGTLNMKQDSWLMCHINMYKYFGGTTPRLVPDNLKTGVVEHPKDGEIVLNDSYEDLANHYNTAILPTGVRKPKEKASVEGTVGNIATDVIAKLRNKVFHSLYEINQAILEELKKYNDKPFTKREGSRSTIFEEMEKPNLGSLPNPYEITHWSYEHKVGYNSHVVFEKNYYSVPHQYIGKYANIKYNKSLVMIFIDGDRIASHHRFPEYARNKYSTIPEHVPGNGQNPILSLDRILDWAKKIGPNTLLVIERIFEPLKVKEQGLNPAQAILRISRRYSPQLLESACREALDITNNPRYKHINSILSHKQEELNKNIEKMKNEGIKNVKAHLRGASYFGGKK